MARVLKRVAAKRDLTDHFVFLGETPAWMWRAVFFTPPMSAFRSWPKCRKLGAQRTFRKPHWSSVRAWPVKGFERYLIFYRPLTDRVEILRVIPGRDIERLFR